MCMGKGHSHSYHHGRNCCGDDRRPSGFQRRFLSKEERKAQLENYLKDLQMEVKTVEEMIKELGEGA